MTHHRLRRKQVRVKPNRLILYYYTMKLKDMLYITLQKLQIPSHSALKKWAFRIRASEIVRRLIERTSLEGEQLQLHFTPWALKTFPLIKYFLSSWIMASFCTMNKLDSSANSRRQLQTPALMSYICHFAFFRYVMSKPYAAIYHKLRDRLAMFVSFSLGVVKERLRSGAIVLFLPHTTTREW